MDQWAIFIMLAVILIVGGLLFFLISRATTHGGHLNVEAYRVRYLAIEQKFRSDKPDSFRLTVIDGDKLVDQALRDSGIKGSSMGERLKNSRDRFSDINSLWQAHKLRNRIVHETDITVNYEQAKAALIGFKRALKDLGAI